MDTNGYETPETPGGSTFAAPRRRPGGAPVSGLCWLLGSGALLASGARLATSGSTGTVAWIVDGVAIFSGQIGGAAIVLALLMLALRRRGPAVLALCAAVVGLSGVLLATRAPLVGPGGVPANGPEGSVVRVLVANTYVLSDRPTQVAEFLDAQEVDAAIVLEAHQDLMQLLRDAGRPLRKRLAYAWIPPENWKGYWYLFTKWPQGGGPDNRGFIPQPHMVICSVVERPPELGGPFLMIACHLFSPHTPTSRDEGNEKLRHIIAEVAAKGEAAGLPVLVGGDFNCPPTAWRSRELTKAAGSGGGGLERAKPWSVLAGTRPGGTWPLSVAIDDVFVSPGAKVVSWKTVEIPGSDHAGVIAEVWVPRGTKPVTAPAGSTGGR